MKGYNFIQGIIRAHNVVITPVTLSQFNLQTLDDWYATGSDKDFQEFIDAYGDKYKYIFGGNNDCIDYYTSVILPDCWVGKDQDNHEEIKDLPFIVRQF